VLRLCAGLIERRREEGMVRHCHGDLHLANICLVEDRPTLFDALEFRDSFAVIDVMFDVAFVLMDLERVRLRGLAGILLNRYLSMTYDYRGLQLLPLFLSLRAGIRAHVALTNQQPGLGSVYFSLAQRLIDPGCSPCLMAVGGLSGSGKSTLTRALAPCIRQSPTAICLHSDVTRKRIWGQSPDQKLSAQAYSKTSSDQVYERLREYANDALAAGRCVIVDAVFLQEAQRHLIEEVAQRLGVPFIGIWLDAPRHKSAERIERRQRDASDASVQVLDAQSKAELGAMSWTRIDAARNQSEVLLAALKLLSVNSLTQQAQSQMQAVAPAKDITTVVSKL
jgi:predicted kinase